MIRPIAIATAILVATAIPALAQGGNPPASQGTRPPMVIGQTGTMYDGNNANLQLPSEQNAYWARLWAEPGAGISGDTGSALAVGSGTAGTSLGAPRPAVNIDYRQTHAQGTSHPGVGDRARRTALAGPRVRADSGDRDT